ncbi:phosphatase, non-receptor type [Chamberlinius hualienensis]
MTASESEIKCKETSEGSDFSSCLQKSNGISSSNSGNTFRQRCLSTYDGNMTTGPEFINRLEEPAIQLNLHSDLSGNRLVTVVCLNGQRLEIKYNPQRTGVEDIFALVVEHLNLSEKYLFGLAQLKGEEYMFLELESKLTKHLNCNRFLPLIDDNAANTCILYLRVKFYIDNDQLKQTSTRHMFYLQMRKDLIDCRISCDLTDCVILASFALQCEHGDYSCEHFNEINFSYYVPKWLTQSCNYNDVIEQIKAIYISHKGMHPLFANNNFIEKVLLLPEYGFHFYTVLQEKQNPNSQVLLGICPQGITIFDKKMNRLGGNRLELQNFPWKCILRLTFDKCQFLVALQNQSLRNRIVNYQFYTHQHEICKYLFNLASSHHRFYLRFQLKSQEPSWPNELAFGSIKSNLDRNGIKSKRNRKAKLRSQSVLVLNSKGLASLPKGSRTLSRYDKATTFFIPKRIKRRLLSSVFKLNGTYVVDDESANNEKVEVANNENISALLSEATGTISSCVLNETGSPSLKINETLSDTLLHRFDNMTGIELKTERRLTAVSLKRDQRDSLGITIMKGLDGAAYIKAARSGSALGIHPGDRILAVNGKSVQSLCFSGVVEMIRKSAGSVELVLSQTVQHNTTNKERFETTPKYNNNLQRVCSELILAEKQKQRMTKPNANSCNRLNQSQSKSQPQITNSSQFDITDQQFDSQIFSPFVPLERTKNFCQSSPFVEAVMKPQMKTDVGELIFSSSNIAFTACGMANSGLSEIKNYNEFEWMNQQPASSVYDYIHVFLKQIDGKFGFKLKSQLMRENQTQIIIESVDEHLQQKIRPGDVILEIGGKSVGGLEFDTVVQLLRDSPQVVHLAIKRRTRSVSVPSSAATQQRSKSDYENRSRLSDHFSYFPTTMVSKHEQQSKESLLSDYSVDSPSSTSSTPDLDESLEPKTVVWQRNVSGSVKARISDIESQAQKTGPRFSFRGSLGKSTGGSGRGFMIPKFSSLDQPKSSENGEDSLVAREIERHSAVKSRPYRPHHSAQLLRSKTMPSVLQMLDGVNDTTTKSDTTLKWQPAPPARTAASQPLLRTSWSSPRATSIDDGRNNVNYSSFESMGITKPLTKLFNGNNSISSNQWIQKNMLKPPEPTIRVTRSLTPECPLLRPSLIKQNHTELGQLAAAEHLNGSQTNNIATNNVIWDVKLDQLKSKYPFINEKTVFRVTLEKKSRGLGIGICGGGRDPSLTDWSSIFIRVKRLYPLQPALESGQLKLGDIILRVNEHNLTDLGHYEAVEALRVAVGTVYLLICRPKPGVLPPLPMEFEIELEKIGGGLGFTLINSSSFQPAGGHYIKDLVKDPSLSDGRLKPGDQILMVNDIELTGLTHEEAILCLRKSPSIVKLLLCRQPDPQSPLSANDVVTYGINGKDKKVLRKEAQDLLHDKIRRNNSNSNSTSGSSSGGGRRQRLKCLNNSSTTNLSVDSAGDQSDNTASTSDIDSRRSTPTPTHLTECFRVPNVRSFLSQEALNDVDSHQSLNLNLVQPSSPLKSPSTSSLSPSMDYNHLSPESGSVPSLHVSSWDSTHNGIEENVEVSSNDVVVELRSSAVNKISAYVNGDSSIDPSHLSPNLSSSSTFRRVVSCDGVTGIAQSTPKDSFSSAGLKKWRGAALESCQEKSNDNLIQQTTWDLLIIDLERHNNERLGFTLMQVEIGNLKGSFVRVIQPVGLAHEDGRLYPGDRLLKVNGISTESMANSDVIDLLRRQHGRISLEIARHVLVSNALSNLIQLSLV